MFSIQCKHIVTGDCQAPKHGPYDSIAILNHYSFKILVCEDTLKHRYISNISSKFPWQEGPLSIVKSLPMYEASLALAAFHWSA